jgi:hypothetical protein
MAASADDLVTKAELITELLPDTLRVMQASRSRKRLADAVVHSSPRPGSRW